MQLISLLTPAAAMTAMLLAASVTFAQTTPARTIWEGTFTSAQAERGKAAYETHCVSCHKADLAGIEDALKGERFFEKRREDNLEHFFLDLKQMPLRRPGSLSNDTYLDILSFVLQENAFPSGTAELKLEVLPQVRVVGKDGPQPVPGFSPVLVVGCMRAGPNDTWQLLEATEPVRNRNPFDRVEDEIKASAAAPLGTLTFRLQEAEYLDPKPKSDHKVQAKGTLVRAPAGNRIVTSSLEIVAAECNPLK